MLSALKLPGVRWILGLHAADLALEYASSIALMVLVYDATNSPIAAAGMLVAKQVVPGFLAVAVGRLLEPVELRRGLATAYAVRAAALLMLASVSGGAPLYLLAFAAGIAGTASRVFVRTTVARATAGPRFRSVSAAQNVVFGLMALLGPAAGAVAASVAGAGPSLRGWAALAIGLAVMVGTMPSALRCSAGASGQASDDEGRAIAEAPRDAAPNSGIPVWGLLALGGLLMVAFAMDEPALLAYVRGPLASDVGVYGLILVVWGVGMVVGGLLYARFGLDRPFGAIVVGVAASAVGYIGLGFAVSVPMALAAAVVGGAGNGSYWVAIVTAVLESSPDGQEARASGRLEGLATAMPALGIVLGGVVAEVVSPRVTLWLPGLVALAGLAAWVLAVRHAMRPASSQQPASTLLSVAPTPVPHGAQPAAAEVPA